MNKGSKHLYSVAEISIRAAMRINEETDRESYWHYVENDANIIAEAFLGHKNKCIKELISQAKSKDQQ
jgi:hypothetical protein